MVDARVHRKSLPLALKRYSAIIGLMEQTVLLPSLLRDVPWDGSGSEPEAGRDLYDTFLMLKAVRNTVESGLVPLEEQAATSKTLETLLDSDPERLFRFHLRGLFSVMSTLTDASRSLTQRYMDIIGFSE
ncbi:mid1-interacting protein 1-B-like [Synchiropus splendidus]|uniref:mid1-interacting protein 1-B-like n=1 Tax=Synchiropus splendidus TaxID=270530 RepID=UPI00237EBB9F|nr:mid1-interacting protein 1-B-like [Synchiropus splendidus]